MTQKERKALELQAIGGGKNACLPWKWAVGKNTLVEVRVYFVI
jgi:hypothetical protein